MRKEKVLPVENVVCWTVTKFEKQISNCSKNGRVCLLGVDFIMESSAEESDGEPYNVVDASNLRPYDFESVPLQSNSQTHVNRSDMNNSCAETRRGNTTWCKCRKCRTMESEEESLCCCDDVPDSYFEGKACITEKNISGQFVRKGKTVLFMLNTMRGDDIPIENRSLRYAGYRQFTWWVHNRLGRGIRKAIPSCSIMGNKRFVPRN